MPQDLVQYSVSDIERIGNFIAKSNLFGIKTSEAAVALCLLAQAEGRHPVEAARDYHIIEGKPSKTADAMLRDFLHGGGKVDWHKLDDTKADATFSHPQGGTIKIDWDMERAKKAGLGNKAMWSKYPRQMLRARVISEGVRTVFPAATSGMYVPEETQDFDNREGMRNVTPAAPITSEAIQEVLDSAKEREVDLELLELESQAEVAAKDGNLALTEFLKKLPQAKKNKLVPNGLKYREIAKKADEEKLKNAPTAAEAINDDLPEMLKRG